MFSTVYTGALNGVSAYIVSVEVDVSNGLPGFNMVGSLSGEVREARERVCVTLKNLGIDIPPMRITVNLAPADQRKEGTAFDLPIAIGLLCSLDIIPKAITDDTLFIGELGLNGEIKKAKGILPVVMEAAAKGIKRCIVPAENAREGGVIPSVEVTGVATMAELMNYLIQASGTSKRIIPNTRVNVQKLFMENESGSAEDFKDVCGQESAKMAAQIAAAGFHNMLMIGPPGVGKSMMARRIPSILPILSLEESLEVTAVYSVAGLMKEEEALITGRPFQSPHHTVTLSALTGGGRVPKPGIISLAHRGVLFLDELPEFKRETIDALRQPLEEKKINISRMAGNVTYPADIMLVCAMNPCPCGYFPDKNRCNCTQPQIKNYMGKVSGPILDRIDLCVELEAVDVHKLSADRMGEDSITMRNRVIDARKIQTKRFENTKIRFNADMDVAAVEKFCKLGVDERELMEKMYESLGLSARGYHRIIKVARTIADLKGDENISVEHLLEAACYRLSYEA